MAKDTLPKQVNPARFAENAAHLHGYLQVKDMPMLCKSLAGESGDVEVELKFGVDKQGIKYVHGHIQTQLELNCQRCLENFKHEIIGEFLSGLVTSEEAAKLLPDVYDPCLYTGNELLIRDLIEEELILSLPIVPMHAPDFCQKILPLEVGKEISGASIQESPFKVIESLKRHKE